MSSPLRTVASEKDVKTGVSNTDAIADALCNILSDTYRLTFKTHVCHWNVEGPLFYAIHNLTEAHYEELFAATDVIAERIRALGHLAPVNFNSMMEQSVVTDLDKNLSAEKMVNQLADDHERIAHRLHALIEIAAANRDEVTADLATARPAFHEKAVWMLRAITA